MSGAVLRETYGASGYQHLLSKPSARQWKRIGIGRRAGVAVALFSLYSKRSVGIGDFWDLKLLVCRFLGNRRVRL